MLHSKRARGGVLAAAGLALVLPLAACGSSATKPAATTIKPTATTVKPTGTTAAAMHDSTTAAGSTSTTVKK